MATDYWIKLYVEILDDPKMGTLPDRAWRRIIELFLLAGKLNGTDKTGILPDTRQIAWALRLNADELELDLQQIAGTGIIERIVNGWKIVNFEKRQAAVSSTERWRQHRDRKRKQEYYSNDSQTFRLTDTDTDTDTDKEELMRENALSNAFTNKTSIQPHDLEKWSNALQALNRAGVTADEIPVAIDLMDADELTYSGLWSVVNKAVWVHSRRERGLPISTDKKNGNGHKPAQPTKQDLVAQAIAKQKARRENGND